MARRRRTAKGPRPAGWPLALAALAALWAGHRLSPFRTRVLRPRPAAGARRAAPARPAPAPAEPSAPPAPAAPETFELELRFRWDGQPIPGFAGQAIISRVSRWAEKDDDEKENVADGKITRGSEGMIIKGLSRGEYHVDIKICPAREYEAGCYYSAGRTDEVPVGVPAAGAVDVVFERFLKYLAPHEAAREAGSAQDWEGLPSLAGPLRFEWESLGPGVEYEASIGVLDVENAEPAQEEPIVKKGPGTSWQVTLLSRPKPLAYAIDVGASRGGQAIGRTSLFRFRVP